jgi:hypothetical protein
MGSEYVDSDWVVWSGTGRLRPMRVGGLQQRGCDLCIAVLERVASREDLLGGRSQQAESLPATCGD